MENGKGEPKLQNPESGANVFSRVFFIWTITFFKKVLNDPSTYSELPVLHSDRADILAQKLETFWETEVKLANYSQRMPIFWNALSKIYGRKKRLFDFILLVNYAVMRPGLCILLAVLIRTFREEYDIRDRCIFGSIFIIISLITFTTEHFVHFELNKIGMRMRAAVSSLIYRKILKLESKSLEEATVTHILNLVSDDVRHFQTVARFGSMSIICVIQFIVILLAMWLIIGYPSLAGLLLVIVVVFPINSTYSRMQKTHKLKLKESTDIRVKFISEIIEGMKTIKMNNWEKWFEKIIKITRQLELKNVSKSFKYQLTFYGFFLHKFCTFISIILLFFYNKTLEPECVFSCSMFLFVALISVFYWIPRSLLAYDDSYNTVSSVTKLLLMKEVKQTNNESFEKPEITLERICFHWSPDDEFDLRAEDIKIKPGNLCLVIGPKGAGKSTLLQLILKELLPRCGKVEVSGTVSYCSQNPWLYNSNIRNNILFGRNYKETKYKNVINTCNLLPDFSQFMNSDSSGVGPGGVVLGKGQKCRINLARAVYHEADVYIIDDVLSFMDFEISNKLFDDCFTRYLARKTRVVVSNQIQFLDKADQIIVVHEGRIKIFDNLTQIKDNNIDIYTWIEDENSKKKIKEINLEPNMDKLEFKSSREDISYCPIMGTKSFNSIFEYTKTGQFFILTCFLLITAYVVIIWCDYWLAYWSNKTYRKTEHPSKISSLFSNIIEDPTSPTYHEKVDLNKAQTDLLVYNSLIVASVLLISLSNGFLLNFFETAARRLHENLSFSVLRAPMNFFYTNSMAKTFRIFTSDVEIIDKTFPETSMEAVEVLLYSMGCILLIYITEWILFFSVMIVVLYILIMHVYLDVIIVLKSLENNTRFSILSHLKDTLHGLTTIRIHQGQEKSVAQFEKFLDNYTSLHRLNLTCMFSFIMWSDLLCNTFLFFTIFGLIIINDSVHPVNPSYAGLAILQVYQLTEILQYGVKKLMQSVLNAESINRIIEYSKIPPEQHKKYYDSLEFATSKSKLSLISLVERRLAPENWPEEGVIEFRNVSLTYPNKVQGLDDVNFTIKGHEKVGIVGRPGSGKSSLVSAIFDLHDFDGTIMIDNFDTKIVVLEYLRKNISVIQHPMLFSECIAYNLDPLGEFLESALWDVLEEVNLKQCLGSLCEVVDPSNTKFSKGQVLLVCLARAILRKNKIIIFDEATTDVDEETEQLFYKLVKKHFSDCTVIYITSNLNTSIIECDRVMVMEKGQVVDYDHPFSLLESEGAFYKLVSEAGKPVYSHYRHLAYQQYVSKFRSSGI